jgi:hypothetical protein
MKRAGLEDRQIANITGHKNMASLSNYDSIPSGEQRVEAAKAIMGSGENKLAGSSKVVKDSGTHGDLSLMQSKIILE